MLPLPPSAALRVSSPSADGRYLRQPAAGSAGPSDIGAIGFSHRAVETIRRAPQCGTATLLLAHTTIAAARIAPPPPFASPPAPSLCTFAVPRAHVTLRAAAAAAAVAAAAAGAQGL